jgi:hypothetical protein
MDHQGAYERFGFMGERVLGFAYTRFKGRSAQAYKTEEAAFPTRNLVFAGLISLASHALVLAKTVPNAAIAAGGSAQTGRGGGHWDMPWRVHQSHHGYGRSSTDSRSIFVAPRRRRANLLIGLLTCRGYRS